MDNFNSLSLASPTRRSYNPTPKSVLVSPPARIKVYNPIHKKYEYECVFCKGNNQPEYVYKNHPIRINETIICPSLRSHVCRLCGATGDNAHTIKYCPFNNRGFFAGFRQPPTSINITTPMNQGIQPLSMPAPKDKFGFVGGLLTNETTTSTSTTGKQPFVRKLNFDEPIINLRAKQESKSTPGFFKNLQQFQNMNISTNNNMMTTGVEEEPYWKLPSFLNST